LLTFVVHGMVVVAFFLIAAGLPGSLPSLTSHFFIIPLSMVAAAVPLPMGGLGALEAMLAYLYQLYGLPAAKGLLVSLVYRVITILVAMVGVLFYIRTRRELRHVLAEDQVQ
jgi:uncharacterized membrane protein YbhN (UPF0104 family)